MKRMLSLLLILSLLILLPMPAKAEEAPIPIRDREGLEAIAENPSGSYVLEADIDLSGEDWVPIPFSGEFNGQGHTLYNLRIRSLGETESETVDGNNKRYPTRFAALFSVVENARIRDLHLLGVDVEIETDNHCFAAMLAGSARDTEISDCSAQGRVRLYTTNKMVGVGGLVGFGHGRIQDCKVDAELVFADRSDRSGNMRCEQFMGGLVGTGVFDLLDNTVEIRGYDSCYGFVHNGGLNGMHFVYTGVPNREVCGNSVNGFISFFEKNPQRRAYCKAYIGEALPVPKKMKGNEEDFLRDEQKDATGELKPETCETPDYETNSAAHTDTQWGYTEHTCKTCGHSFRYAYVAPGHIPGDWETVQAPDYETEGKAARTCTLCGQVVEEKPLSALVPVQQIQLSQREARLHYKDTLDLRAQVLPEDAEDRNVVWSSSDGTVAAVDDHGHVTALGRGTAVITCRSADGYASDSCTLSVNFSLAQWLIEILLFGWVWY